MKELIEHISVNAITYIDEYSIKDIIGEKEKGILTGLWMDLDSIKNHLAINNEKSPIDIETLMDDLQKLINK